MTALAPLPRHHWDAVYYSVVMERDTSHSLTAKAFNLCVVGTGVTIQEAKNAAIDTLMNTMGMSPATYEPYVRSVMDCGLDSGVRRECGSPAQLIVRYCDAKLYIYAHDKEYGYDGLTCFYDPAYSGHLARFLTYKYKQGSADDGDEEEGDDDGDREQRRDECGRSHLYPVRAGTGRTGAFRPLSARLREAERR